LRWEAWPALIFHGLHAPDARSLSWFYSGVALEEEVCYKICGVQAVRVIPIWSPLLHKSCTWSVSDDDMFQAYFGEVTMALISILFAARCCQLHELGILCWGTSPNLPTTSRILDRTLCCHDHMHACLRRRAIVFSYLLLLRSICHDPSFVSHHDSLHFVSPPWHIQQLTYSVLP
jgi:hypothetical protein